MGNHTLIVGGSCGIGHSLASLLQENQNKVSVIARNRADLAEDINFMQADICDFQTELPTFNEKINSIVYLPGSITLKPFSQLTLEDFQSDLNINYLGAVRVLKQYIKNINTEDNASIVLVSSVAAKTGLAYHASIASAKAAVEGLTLSLAAELAPKIRVNAVAPSIVETGLSANLLNSDVKKTSSAQKHPLKKIGTPKDIANAIAFLLSSKSGWITGQVLHVDGGFSSLKNL